MAKRIVAEEVLVDRTGQFEHPVLITFINERGSMVEQLCCRNCAETSEPVSVRATAVVAGVTCPLCKADLSPA